MVKTIIKSYASRVCGTKRVRGLKSRTKSNNSTKKVKNNSRKIQAKPFDMNYYSQPKINFLLSQEDNTITRLLKKESLEFSEIKPDVTPKYKQEHRAVALIGLKDIIYQVYELCKGNVSLSDNFVFSVIALYELYIRNSEKDLSKSENIKSLFSCLDFCNIIGKFKLIAPILNRPSNTGTSFSSAGVMPPRSNQGLNDALHIFIQYHYWY